MMKNAPSNVSPQSTPSPAKRSLLVTLPSVPWPPRRNGFALRYFPILEHLSQRHSVDLLILGDHGAWHDLGPLATWGEITLADIGSSVPSFARRVFTIARGAVPRSAPYVLRNAWTFDVVRAVRQASERKQYDTMLWTSPGHFEAALKVAQMRPAKRCVFDLIDSPTLLAAVPARSSRSVAVLRGIAQWEAELQHVADRVIYISATDATAVGDQGCARRTLVVPNGVYMKDFAEGLALPRSQDRQESGPSVLFFGHMSYEPNVDAALWLAREIMPKVKLRVPGAKLVIAGHQPADSVRALANEQTIVTGSVPSIWPYIRSADVCVFPLRMGAGLQNKILEAMAVGAAVVTTSRCAASIWGAMPGEHLLVADTVEQISDATVRVLSDRDLAARLTVAGPGLVRDAYNWENRSADFERALFG